MSFADIMLFSTELDVFRQRFRGIFDYANLHNNIGYKFIICNNQCELDPPSLFQGLTRWYYGHSQADFEKFLRDNKVTWEQYLKRVLDSSVVRSRTYQARKFIAYLCGYVNDLSKACNLCRSVYPTSESIRLLLLNYYHTFRSWVNEVDLIQSNRNM